MEKKDLDALIKKYKDELMKIGRKQNKSVPIIAEVQQNNDSTSQVDTQYIQTPPAQNIPPVQATQGYTTSFIPNTVGDSNITSQPIPNTNTLYTVESIPIIETYQDFLTKNTDTGSLKIQAYAAQQAIPVSGVNVTISKQFSDLKKVFYENLVTDESGIIDNIILPAPSPDLSMDPNGDIPYENYDVVARNDKYYMQTFLRVPIFPNTKSIQPIALVPNGN